MSIKHPLTTYQQGKGRESHYQQGGVEVQASYRAYPDTQPEEDLLPKRNRSPGSPPRHSAFFDCTDGEEEGTLQKSRLPSQPWLVGLRWSHSQWEQNDYYLTVFCLTRQRLSQFLIFLGFVACVHLVFLVAPRVAATSLGQMRQKENPGTQHYVVTWIQCSWTVCLFLSNSGSYGCFIYNVQRFLNCTQQKEQEEKRSTSYFWKQRLLQK